MRCKRVTYLIAALALALLVGACASIGSPEGGPRDYTPPVVTKSSPAPNSLNFKGNKVTINFDEVVTLQDQQKKVIVSPAQTTAPTIKALGKRVTVELNDTLLPNTTYTIDFSDAIQDNNEGNRLDNYSFAFSTGDNIDTLAISGIVLRARDLEPMQSVLVGVTSNLSDTAFSTLPLQRVSRTNDKGEFIIRNLKPGRYHVFALNDVDGNYTMSRSEDMAFLDQVIVPSVRTFTSQDTTFTFDHRVDTIVTGTHTEFLPNNILLSMFNENYRQLYLMKNERTARNKLLVQFGAPVPQLPRIHIISPERHAAQWYCLQEREQHDSLVYWLTDSALIKADSIVADMHYMKLDSLNQLVEAHDTVYFTARRTNAEIREAKQQAKDRESAQKEMAKLQQRLDKALAQGKDTTEIMLDLRALQKQTAPKVQRLTVKPEHSGSLEVTDSLTFTFETPIDTIFQNRLHLSRFNEDDSTWTAVDLPPMRQASPYEPMRYGIALQLEPEAQYQLTLDSAAIRSIYNLVNDSVTFNVQVKSLHDYGTILLHSNATPRMIAQLLTSGEKVLRTQAVKGGGDIEFNLLPPGDYFVRLIDDVNGNGKWDTGNYGKHLQPEDVYYYPRRLSVRKDWTNEVRGWDIDATAVDKQKPDAIKKNKPEQRKDSLDQKKKKSDTGEDEDDEFNSNGYGRNAYSGNKYRDYQNQRR